MVLNTPDENTSRRLSTDQIPRRNSAADQPGHGTLAPVNPAHEALRYAAAGYPVFPCRSGGKGPAIPSAHPEGDPLRGICTGECGRDGHGFHDATTDPDRIRGWWHRWPTANVAIRTGAPGPDVLDVDVKPDGNGFAALNRLIRAGLATGARALVRTRSGGLHIHYAGTAQPCGSLPRHHLDFKAAGGYVLVPPSFVDADTKGPAGRYVLLDHQAGAATFDWSAAKAVLDPPRRPPTRTPPAWTGPGLPPSVRRALTAPADDRSAALHRLVAACARSGLDAATIHQLAAAYQPALEKYGDRLPTEVERSLRKIGAVS